MSVRPTDIIKPPVKARWGLNVHPSLLRMARVINEEQYDLSGLDVPGVVTRLTIQFPTLSEVHARYDPHFAGLRESGDPRAEAKERSFFAAVQDDLESLGSDRTAIVEQPFITL